MANTFNQLARPSLAVVLLVCASFPFGWNRIWPETSGDPVSVALLGVVPVESLGVPGSPVVTRRTSPPSTGSEQRLVFEFELERAGRYSVFGISSHRRAAALDLGINGVWVSANAFFQDTGSDDADFERHLLARNVQFFAGTNRASLAGLRVLPRSFVLELREELPLRPMRYAALAIGLGCLWALRRYLVDRFPPTHRIRLPLAASLFAASLLVLPWISWQVSGGHIVSFGERDPIKTRNLRALEETLESDRNRVERDEKFSVFVMGDSTQFFSLPPEHHMVPVLDRALRERGGDGFAVNGMAGAALNGFDFYLLLNRIAREAPDVVVIPVSMRSFAEYWLHEPGYRYHRLDHYLSPIELLRSWNLSVAGREITLVGWLLRQLDAAWFGGGGEDLLRGTKVFFDNELERRESEALRTMTSWKPLSVEIEAAVEPNYPRWNTRISTDHELVDAFHRINDFAARQQIQVLYYTVQANVEAQRELGRDLRIGENFTTLERAIGFGPGVHFLRLVDHNPREMFSDHVDHLTPDGIAAVAAALAVEITALAGEE